MNSPDLRDLRKIADLMDKHYRGPYGWRFGWDGLLGMIPVVGDIATNFVSLYFIFRAAQIGCPPSVVLRMGINILVENLVDIIPFFGNLFDFVWRSNSRNLALVESYFANPKRVHNRSRLFVASSFTLVLILVVGCLVLAVQALLLIIGWLDQLAA